MTEFRRKQKQKQRNLLLKKRYQIYRAKGYSAKESRALSQLKLDAQDISLSKKTGKVARSRKNVGYILKLNEQINNNTISYKMNTWSRNNQDVKTSTQYATRWGLLTHDDGYKGETANLANKLKSKYDLSDDQAYYFLYFMYTNNFTYSETCSYLLSEQDFEQYREDKKVKKRHKN